MFKLKILFWGHSSRVQEAEGRSLPSEENGPKAVLLLGPHVSIPQASPAVVGDSRDTPVMHQDHVVPWKKLESNHMQGMCFNNCTQDSYLSSLSFPFTQVYYNQVQYITTKLNGKDKATAFSYIFFHL